MRLVSGAIYLLLLTSVLFINKYVLSVLGFQYPMVFQGWQTLVGFVVFKALSLGGFSSAGVTPMDKAGFISLFPNFVLFVVCIIAGSKAISTLSLVTFVCALNVLPAAAFLIDSSSSSLVNKPQGNTAMQRICSLLIIVTSVVVVLTTSRADVPVDELRQRAERPPPGLMFGDTFWLCVHIGCGLALSLHSRITDQRFSFSDRLFYSYVFALVVLAPASLYLEEAFEALHFKHRRQLRFVLGSVFAACVGVAQSLTQARLKEDPMFARLHHAGLAGAAVLSVAFFPTELPWWTWACAAVNLSGVIVLPSHIKPDEKIQVAMSPPPNEEDNVALLKDVDEADLEVGLINQSVGGTGKGRTKLQR